jgi:hypothetical protein
METILLQAINNALDANLRDRHALLSKKQSKDSISEIEQQELLNLIDIIEEQYAQRLEYLIELAHLKGVTFDILMKQLKLNFA